MKRKFEALSWSEWNWQRPFSEEDVKSLLGQLVGLTRRKSIVFEVRMTKNRVQYLLGTEEQDKRHISQLIQSHRAIQFSRVSKREKLSVARLVNIKESHYALKIDSAENMIRSSLAISKILQPDETVVVQLVIGAGSPPRPQPKDLPKKLLSFLARSELPQVLSTAICARITEEGIPYLTCCSIA